MVIRVYISSSSYVTDIDALFPRPSPLTARMRHAVSTPRRASAAVHTVSLFPLFVSLLCKISDITLAEMYFGAFKSGREKHFEDVREIEDTFESYPIMYLRKYGELRWMLEKNDNPIPRSSAGDFCNVLSPRILVFMSSYDFSLLPNQWAMK